MSGHENNDHEAYDDARSRRSYLSKIVRRIRPDSGRIGLTIMRSAAPWEARVVLVTTHVLSGAVIGALAPDVPAALTRGFVSHFVLDAIPHWGCEPDELLRIAVPDGLIGLAAIAAVGIVATPSRRVPVLAGVFGACLPDIDKPSELFFGRSPFPWWFDRFHQMIQHERPHRWKREVTVAAGMAALAAVVLRAQHTR